MKRRTIVLFLTVVGIIGAGVVQADEQVEERSAANGYLDAVLGERRNDPVALAELARDQYEKDDPTFAVFSLYRLKSMEPEKTTMALPLIIRLVGVRHAPTAGSPTFDFYPADGVVLHCGSLATPYIVEALGNQHITDSTRRQMEHLVDILVKIEERKQAEQVLLEKLQNPPSTIVAKNLQGALALLRARENLIPLGDKETPTDRFQEELQRIKDEGIPGEKVQDEKEEKTPKDQDDSVEQPGILPTVKQPDISPAGETSPKEESPIPPSCPSWLVSNGHWIIIGVIALMAVIVAGVIIKKKR